MKDDKHAATNEAGHAERKSACASFILHPSPFIRS
jgi:hypothetical protein